jgi:hypothetical protein
MKLNLGKPILAVESLDPVSNLTASLDFENFSELDPDLDGELSRDLVLGEL